jgi:protein SCO1/2
MLRAALAPARRAGARASRALSAAPAGGAPAARGPVSWATLALSVAAGAGAVVYYNVSRAKRVADASSRVESFGQALLGGPWSLVDAAGRPVTSGDLHGKFVLLYFGFTFCPDICPNELVKMARVTDALDALPAFRDRVVPVFITLDPARDTCAQVGAYCADFHPKMLGLTGTPGQVAQAAKAYRVYFSEVDRGEGDAASEDYLGALRGGAAARRAGPRGARARGPLTLSSPTILPQSTTRSSSTLSGPTASSAISSRR